MIVLAEHLSQAHNLQQYSNKSLIYFKEDYMSVFIICQFLTLTHTVKKLLLVSTLCHLIAAVTSLVRLFPPYLPCAFCVSSK